MTWFAGVRLSRFRSKLESAVSEPGIRRGNEDSRGNENRKSRKKFFSAEKQIDKHTFFLNSPSVYGNHAVKECEFASKIER